VNARNVGGIKLPLVNVKRPQNSKLEPACSPPIPTIQHAISTVYVANQRFIGLSERARQTNTARAVRIPERAMRDVCANSDDVSLELPKPWLRGIHRGYGCESMPAVCGRAERHSGHNLGRKLDPANHS
jgi:hypothetical protein